MNRSTYLHILRESNKVKKTNIIPEDNYDELEDNSERTEMLSNLSQKLWLSLQEDPEIC